MRPLVDSFATLLERARHRGEISTYPDPAIVLNTVVGAVQQLALLGMLDRDELVAHGTRLVLSGMVD
ncbi:MAG: hypothetical protein R2695_18780 [Acidimicrobiales bacterium]